MRDKKLSLVSFATSYSSKSLPMTTHHVVCDFSS